MADTVQKVTPQEEPSPTKKALRKVNNIVGEGVKNVGVAVGRAVMAASNNVVENNQIYSERMFGRYRDMARRPAGYYDAAPPTDEELGQAEPEFSDVGEPVPPEGPTKERYSELGQGYFGVSSPFGGGVYTGISAQAKNPINLGSIDQFFGSMKRSE
jgi:hypothetical protein